MHQPEEDDHAKVQMMGLWYHDRCSWEVPVCRFAVLGDNVSNKSILVNAFDTLRFSVFLPAVPDLVPVSLVRHMILQVRAKWDVLRIALVHRLGVTAVEEASVIIAVSSVHRKDSLEAVEYAINTLKATVPIWKLVSERVRFGRHVVVVLVSRIATEY